MLCLHLRRVGSLRPILLALLAHHFVRGHVAELFVHVWYHTLPVGEVGLGIDTLGVAAQCRLLLLLLGEYLYFYLLL